MIFCSLCAHLQIRSSWKHHHVIEQGKHQKPAAGKFATTWALGLDGFFDDLHHELHAAVDHIVDLAGLDDLRFLAERLHRNGPAVQAASVYLTIDRKWG